MSDPKPVDILIVEHNPGDIRLITDALGEMGIKPEFRTVWNGIEAMQFLRQEPPFEDAPRPRIILMDLNLPGKHGRVLLQELKSDPLLSLTPVIVFSGSDAPQDISACYALGANCYIVKPRDLYSYNETIRSLADFWLKKARLPLDSEPGSNVTEIK